MEFAKTLGAAAMAVALTIATPAVANAATRGNVTLDGSCIVNIQNGHGINKPWAATQEKRGCAQLHITLYINSSIYFHSGWKSSSSVRIERSGFSTYWKSEHAGRKGSAGGTAYTLYR